MYEFGVEGAVVDLGLAEGVLDQINVNVVRNGQEFDRTCFNVKQLQRCVKTVKSMFDPCGFLLCNNLRARRQFEHFALSLGKSVDKRILDENGVEWHRQLVRPFLQNMFNDMQITVLQSQY